MCYENNKNLYSESTYGESSPSFVVAKFELEFFLGWAFPETDAEARIWEVILGSTEKGVGNESGNGKKPNCMRNN